MGDQESADSSADEFTSLGLCFVAEPSGMLRKRSLRVQLIE